MALVDGGDLLVRALKREGVDTIFTLCGGHVQSIYDACVDQQVRIIDVRHEQAAGHAAEGWSRATRKCGVAVVTAGPGVTDCVTAIANAYQNRSPMLVIGGRTPLNRFEMGALQDLDHTELLRPITKWARTIFETKRIPEYVGVAFRHALTGRFGPVFLDIPSNLLFGKVEEEDVHFPSGRPASGNVAPDSASIQRAAQLLARAKRPVVMAGSQVYWDEAHVELRALIEALGAPLYLNAMGRGAVSQEHALFFSSSRREGLANADVALIVGTPMDFRLGYGKRLGPQTRIIQVDSDPAELGRNRDIEVALQGNAQATLELLAGEINGRHYDHADWLNRLREMENKAAAQRLEFMESDAVPVHPLRLCKEIAQFVDDNTLVVGDGGDIVGLASQVIPINHPGQWYDPGPMGTLGVGTGFCMALSVVHPEKRVIMVNGDGTFGLNGFEFDTAIRFKLPIVGIVGNDAAWGQMLRPQIAIYGKDRAVGTYLNYTRYDKVVEALGGHGEYCTRPEEIRPALERAFASGKPACINVVIRRDETEPKGSTYV